MKGAYSIFLSLASMREFPFIQPLNPAAGCCPTVNYSYAKDVQDRRQILVTHEGLDSQKEAISENATRSVFGWLRSDGWARNEKHLRDHEWFDVFDSDDEDDKVEQEDKSPSPRLQDTEPIKTWLCSLDETGQPCQAAVLTLRNPQQQSGQEYVRCIYEKIARLRKAGNAITIRRSTTLNAARLKLRVERRLPDDVGKLSKEVDVALPGKHTRELYDNLSWRPATQSNNISFHLRDEAFELRYALRRPRADWRTCDTLRGPNTPHPYLVSTTI
ncbi:hypothetical protein HYQ46_002067 [Verticillium longisporum]|nr:hypothetical protein HYQ46_002067 [Verticillium longisporum]